MQLHSMHLTNNEMSKDNVELLILDGAKRNSLCAAPFCWL